MTTLRPTPLALARAHALGRANTPLGLGKVEHKMAALGALVELDESTWLNQAPAFTCMEADVVARFLTAWKEPGIAGDFLERHALDDDEGDDHYALRVAVEAATE